MVKEVVTYTTKNKVNKKETKEPMEKKNSKETKEKIRIMDKSTTRKDNMPTG
jgi:hypothetical protein